ADERLCLWVPRTGEREILPHEHTVRVAPVVERIALIEVAAPCAYYVATRLRQQLQRLVEPFPVACVNRVQRHPVGAEEEDWFSVDHDAETSAVVGGEVGVELDPAKPETRLVAIDGLAFDDELQHDVVQVGPAVAARHPA